MIRQNKMEWFVTEGFLFDGALPTMSFARVRIWMDRGVQLFQAVCQGWRLIRQPICFPMIELADKGVPHGQN